MINEIIRLLPSDDLKEKIKAVSFMQRQQTDSAVIPSRAIAEHSG